MEKDVTALQKEIQGLTDQIHNLTSFMKHNATNFIAVFKPRLKAAFPSKYGGKTGAQILQRDLRLLKVATGGKIPSDLDVMTKCEMEKLIDSGRSKVDKTCGQIESCSTDGIDETVCRDNLTKTHSFPNNSASIVGNPSFTSPISWGHYGGYLHQSVGSNPWFSPWNMQIPYSPPSCTITSPPSSTITSPPEAIYPPLPNEEPPLPPHM